MWLEFIEKQSWTLKYHVNKGTTFGLQGTKTGVGNWKRKLCEKFT